MTSHSSPLAPQGAGYVSSPAGESRNASNAYSFRRPEGWFTSPAGRLVGIDLARAIALLGMMAAHFGAPSNFNGFSLASLGAASHGRASILFAVLAGVSIALVSGRNVPFTGARMEQTRAKLLVRSFWLFVIGAVLAMFNSGILVILPTYAVLFMTATFFLCARKRTLVWWSIGLALCGPLVTASIQAAGSALGLSLPFPEAFFSPAYAYLQWVPFILIGMLVGRIDLSRMLNWLWIGLAGIALAVSGYATIPWAEQAITWFSNAVAGDPTPGDDIAVSPFGWPDTSAPSSNSFTSGKFTFGSAVAGEDAFSSLFPDDSLSSSAASGSGDANVWEGLVDSGEVALTSGASGSSWTSGFSGEFGDETGSTWNRFRNELSYTVSMYASSAPHTGSTNEVVGSLGVALGIISLCLLVTRLIPKLFAPLIAFGSMSLTMYCAHVVSFRYLMDSHPNDGSFAWSFWGYSVAIGILFAFVWRGLIGKGPLERGLAWLVGKTLHAVRTNPISPV